MFPLVFASGAGAASRVSIGFVVLSGMAAATVGVVFVPVLYSIVERVVRPQRAGGRSRWRGGNAA